MTTCQTSNCCVCPNFVSTTTIAQVGTQLQLTVPPTTNLFNGKKLCIAFGQNVPNLTGIPSIAVVVGATTYPIFQCQCDSVHLMYADQLKLCNHAIANRQIVSLVFSSDVGAFTYDGCRRLRKTNAVVTSSSPVAMSAGNTAPVVAPVNTANDTKPAIK